MNRSRILHGSSCVLVAAGLACALATACVDYKKEYYDPLTDPKLATTTTGTGGGGGSGGTGGGGNSGGGGSPVNCDPKADPMTAVDASCGVFVSATGADSDKGTRENPVKTFKQALMLALAQGAKKTIYACAEEFVGPVEVPGGDHRAWRDSTVRPCRARGNISGTRARRRSRRMRR